ncbi:MAG: hypothetical protein N3D15_07285 [Syntrophorhabdaceae bacterium]|nr:hypothetical protein [Syntrophorhabdaceae bacterium]
MTEVKIQNNDLVLICHRDKKYLKKIEENKAFNGKGGTLSFSDLIGNPFGKRYGEYEVYRPTLEDIIMFGVKRDTQIIYPKDAAFICLKLDIKYCSSILEVGTGSGALTIIFSNFIGPEGKIVTIEKEERHFRNAKKNIERFCQDRDVEVINCHVLEYGGSGFDSVFVDVREPWLYMDKVWGFVKESGTIGMIVPTTNQISEILKAFDDRGGFGDIEVIEILLRRYKTVSERIRPFDRMVAHTGYLIFARKLLK